MHEHVIVEGIGCKTKKLLNSGKMDISSSYELFIGFCHLCVSLGESDN